MNFNVDRNPFADAVTWTAKNLPNKPSVPVLAGVMLRTKDDLLHMSGFDYETSTQVSLDVQADSDGAALVSGRLLAEITKALPNKPITITTAGTHLQLVCGAARFTLPTMPVEDYPTLPDMPATAGTVDAATFTAAVAQVAIAAGRDNTLPLMTGVRLETEGTVLSLLATDRYRLAHVDITWAPTNPTISHTVLIPAATLVAAVKGARDGTITLAMGHADRDAGIVGIEHDGRQTTTRLLDGTNYPPVRSLFPTTTNMEATFDVGTLTEVVHRVSLVADRTMPVRLGFTATSLNVEAGGAENARASETMDTTYTGTPLTIAFNPQYLLDGLGALGAPTGALHIVDEKKPAVLTGTNTSGEQNPNYRHLLMPIRIA